MSAAELVVHVRRRETPVGPVAHPLAYRHGVELLGVMLAAGTHWRPLTGKQRAALRRGYLALLRCVRELDVATIPDEGLPIDLPELPSDVHAATARSLQRRGLVDAGRLTGLAVEVVRYADRGVRPIETAVLVGGRL